MISGYGRLVLAAVLLLMPRGGARRMARADSPDLDRASRDFAAEARPLLAKYCLECHSTEAPEGDLDLERFAALADIRREPGVWVKVGEMLDSREMPPKNVQRMPKADRQALRDWLDRYLKAEALAGAGDPGAVVLRRLSNAQYTYTLADLTGVALDPAREFPADGAAGEGFTNAGSALVMSPALLAKYFEAAKGVAAHAVPLPDGLRFSRGASRQDWTNEAVDRIRAFYDEFTDSGGSTQVNLQGIVFGTNAGGRLPLERYLAATIAERDALASGAKTPDAVARERSLSPKYLAMLWATLNAAEPSPLLDPIRGRWKVARPEEAPAIAEQMGRWQAKLWTFNPVGQIGKVGAAKSWMGPVSPIRSRQDFRLKLAAPADGTDLVLTLAADDAGDGSEGDAVVWERPRLVAAGMPDLPLGDMAAVASGLAERRGRVAAGAARSLAAAEEAAGLEGAFDPEALALKHDVPPDVLASWFEALGLGVGPGTVKVAPLLEGAIRGSSGHDFVNGWGSGETPNVIANASDTHVRVPGNLRPHSVAMHPSPSLRVAAGWLSPVSAAITIRGRVQHAHPECGNGVQWWLEMRRGEARQRLASGIAHGPRPVEVGPFEAVPIRRGDLISLVIGPRDGNHSCDLTAVDLTLTSDGATWDLAADISPDVLAGNPHADRLGHPSVWHFFTEPEGEAGAVAAIPEGSALARWRLASSETKAKLAGEVQALLSGPSPEPRDGPDARLHRLLLSARGPLLREGRGRPGADGADTAPGAIGPATFGRLPDGTAIDPSNLGVTAPSAIEVRIPAELADGCEFVTTGMLPASAPEGSVQLSVSAGPAGPARAPGLGPDPDRPVIVADSGPARERFEAAFDAFRSLFPPALCYAKIVPVDEVITLNLFYREDDALRRLMLDDAQAARLDRLWDELRFISQDALILVDAFQQLLEYASQDADPRVLEPLRGPITERAERFRQTLREAEPKQIDAALAFAEKAYRRPLRPEESDELRALYRKLRGEELPHDDALRLVLARALIAPAFLYRVETAGPGSASAPLSDWELASRLSYFLWSSVPDEPLRELAASGRLRDPDVLAAQAIRMMKDEKARRLATEFACQWLQVYEFDALDEKSERHFPTFNSLRSAMYEETILFFADLFRRDLPAFAFLDADATFLNGPLAEHYAIPGVEGPEWRRVEGVRTFGRGGILGLSTTLAKQSGASRTSPILRGNWVSEVLLGEKLPKPPPGVPQLPDDEAAAGGLSVRELVERHSRDPQCASCHARMDPIGFALEGYDAIGRKREKDLGDHPVAVDATMPDGTPIAGLDGLRDYLLTKRKDAVSRQFSRKLLGYALGRGVQLSDGPLLDEMTRLVADGGRIGQVIEAVVRSPQFLRIRGREAESVQADQP